MQAASHWLEAASGAVRNSSFHVISYDQLVGVSLFFRPHLIGNQLRPGQLFLMTHKSEWTPKRPVPCTAVPSGEFQQDIDRRTR